ncbi:MAG: hypothetical protein ACKOW8_14765 [Flavobacteriales bacterium]
MKNLRITGSAGLRNLTGGLLLSCDTAPLFLYHKQSHWSISTKLLAFENS